MRRVSVLLLVLVFVVGACATSSSPSPTGSSPATTSTPAETAAPTVGGGPGVGGNPGPAPVPPARPPAASTTDEKLTAAVLAGELEPGAALLYSTYATLHSELVPQAYRGDDSATAGGDPSASLLALRDHLDELPPDLRAEAQALFRRPTDPGSFWKPALESRLTASAGAGFRLAAVDPFEDANGFVWHAVDSAHVRVWYWTLAEGWEEDPSDAEWTKNLARYRELSAGAAAEAARIAADIDASRMWDLYKGAMLGREPCPDSHLEDDGGDGRLDLYLVPVDVAAPRQNGKLLPSNALGVAMPFADGDGCPRTAILMVKQGIDWKTLRSAVAHEVFHAFSFAFAPVRRTRTLADGKVVDRDFQLVLDYSWWYESTATWAQDLVFPKDNDEHRFIWCWARGRGEPNGPLDPNMCGYAGYQWWFYLTRVLGRPATTVGDAFAASERAIPLDVVGAMPDWNARFKEFNLWNWNRAPLEKYFDPGEGVTGRGHIAKIRQTVTPVSIDLLNGMATLPIELGHTSGQYWEVSIDDRPGDIQRLELDLAKFAGKPGAGIQAIVTIGDPANPRRQYTEDWSGMTEKQFCRDDPDQRVTKLVLVATNSSVKPGTTLSGSIDVEGLESGCSAYAVTIEARSSSTLHAGSWTLTGTLNPHDPDKTYDPDQPIDELVGQGTWTGSGVNPLASRCNGGQTSVTGSGRVWLTGSIVPDGPMDGSFEGPSVIVSAFPVSDEIGTNDGFVPYPPFIDLFGLYAPAEGGAWTLDWVKMAEAECGEPWKSSIAVRVRRGG